MKTTIAMIFTILLWSSESYGQSELTNALYSITSSMDSSPSYYSGYSQPDTNSPSGDMGSGSKINHINSHFKSRQLNRYYNELEKLQYQERVRLKREGGYTIESLNRLYGMGTGY